MPDPRATAPPTDELLDELTALAVDLARRAGALLLDGRASIPALLAAEEVGTKSSPTDMVSEIDRGSEQLLVAGITAARPGDGILGEEGTDRVGTTGLRWVIDPLDGTTNYLYGLPGYGVSIAVEHDGRSVVGVVLDPVHDELFVATVGRGATLGDVPISCTAATDLGHALVGTGFGYLPEVRAAQGAILRELLPRVRDVRRAGAAAVDLCAVACGRLDAYYEQGLQPWDLAAGELVATEAGALVTGVGGGRAGSALTVAAGPGVHGQLRAALVDAGVAAS